MYSISKGIYHSLTSILHNVQALWTWSYRVINMEIEYYKIIKKLHLIIFLVLYKIIDFWYMFKFKEPWHIISVVPLKNIFFDNNCVGKINRNTMNHIEQLYFWIGSLCTGNQNRMPLYSFNVQSFTCYVFVWYNIVEMREKKY